MALDKARTVKVIRNISISAISLLIVTIAAGAGYTWYMGQNDIVDTAAIAIPVEVEAPRAVVRPKPSPNARVGASIQSVTSPVAPGSNASIIVRTTQEATCTISVKYDKTPSVDSGLKAKQADEYGMVDWTWTVGPATPLGKWPVTVTCVYGKMSGVVQADLVVARPE